MEIVFEIQAKNQKNIYFLSCFSINFNFSILLNCPIFFGKKFKDAVKKILPQ